VEVATGTVMVVEMGITSVMELAKEQIMLILTTMAYVIIGKM
jgi:hypothetical protein